MATAPTSSASTAATILGATTARSATAWTHQQKARAAKRSLSSTPSSPLVESKCNNSFPKRFVTWNCNGLVSRCKYDSQELERLVTETNYPDILMLQEVRLKASISDQGVPIAKDYNEVKGPLERIFGDRYDFFWSLTPEKRYSGTLTMVHKHRHTTVWDTAFTTESALNLLLRRYGLTREECGIPASPSKNRSGSSSSGRNTDRKHSMQTSMKAFFAPKVQASPSPTRLSLTTVSRHKQKVHHPQGRFQFILFDNDFSLINTYVPNNGFSKESFEARRRWDEDMCHFVKAHRTITTIAHRNHQRTSSLNNRKKHRSSLEKRSDVSTGAVAGSNDNVRKASSSSCPLLLWSGDMNVARDYRDGTHWSRETEQQQQQYHEEEAEVGANHSRTGHDGGSRRPRRCHKGVYEWWTDESKCFTSKNLQHGQKDPQNVGMPSFTPGERIRFNQCLMEGRFMDVWRILHPNGQAMLKNKNDKELSRWELPNYTWRGNLSRNSEVFQNKYQGKGQRLDYFLLNVDMLNADDMEETAQLLVKRCEILGWGERREGLFCGSDHCAAILELLP